MTPNNQWTIVLIDDEKDIRDVMRLALSDAGYRVFDARDGKTGLRLCKEILPQIIITDIRMPGMDGLMVLERIKKEFPDIEVIVATAFGEMDLAIRALQLDASDFVTKPIGDEAISLALKRAKLRYTSKKQLADYTALLEKENAETSQQLVDIFNFQKNLIESSMDGIFACNKRGNIVTFNKSMEQISGYSREKVIHKMNLVDFFLPGEEQILKNKLSSERYGGKNRLFLYETTLLNNFGKKIPVQVSAARLDDNGKENGLVCFFRDLREIKKLEHEVADQARILHQDKMISLGRLAASVVHEINNPLAGILNYIRLMTKIVKKGPLTDEYQKKFQRYLNLVESETDRCSHIISSLLTFSRKSTPTFKPVIIKELIDRCIILSQHKIELSNIQLIHKVDSLIPNILGDFNQLQQCIINLIFNAIDAMPEGGTIRIEGRHDPNDNHVIILVKDTGSGVENENLPHIFEPFFTTKSEGYGVGLGLPTVYGIMEHHRGKVHVESRKGEGSTFFLIFPLS